MNKYNLIQNPYRPNTLKLPEPHYKKPWTYDDVKRLSKTNDYLIRGAGHHGNSFISFVKPLQTVSQLLADDNAGTAGTNPTGEKIKSTGALFGKTLKSIEFGYAATAGATGTATIGVFNGTTLQTSFGTIDMGTLPTFPASFTQIKKEGSHVIAADDIIGFNHDDAPETLFVEKKGTTDPYDGANSFSIEAGTEFTADDLTFTFEFTD